MPQTAVMAGRAFSVADPSVWNSLTEYLHDPSFRHQLNIFVCILLGTTYKALHKMTIYSINYLFMPNPPLKRGTSWWFHDTVTAHLVFELSPLRVRWNGTCFHTHSGTLLRVPTASDRRWKLIFLRHKGTISVLQALRDALYKSTATTTTTTTNWVWFRPLTRK